MPAPRSFFRRSFSLALSLVVLLGAGRPATGCNVPVFRFALESKRWTPDTLELTVFHHGPLTREQQNQLEKLRQLTRGRGGFLNLELETVDVAGEVPEEHRILWAQERRSPWPRHRRSSVPLPWLVLRHARTEDECPAAWSGPLSEHTVALLVDSPLRREIARRILSGDAVVWVLLESGERDADDRAARLLTARLKELEKEITLPMLDEDDRRHIRSSIPLRVSFPMVRLSRADPAEAALIGLLLHLPKQPELAGLREPIVFPFLGRGRTANALFGEDLSSDGIETAARYLAGRCSCEVKIDNPGADLPFAVDWATALNANASGETLLDEMRGPTASTAQPSAVERKTEGDGQLGRAVLYTALGLLAVVVVGGVLVALRGARRPS